MTWYVVVDHNASDPQPDERIWTVSTDPDVPGWNTDSGFPGYGLTKADAEELVQATQKQSLTIFDFGTGERHPANQEDIDQLQNSLVKMTVQPIPLSTDDRPLPDDFSFRLALYPNRMRDDGLFIAEEKEIEPHKGITAPNGGPVYPATPNTHWRIGVQLPHNFARELVRRWNLCSPH